MKRGIEDARRARRALASGEGVPVVSDLRLGLARRVGPAVASRIGLGGDQVASRAGLAPDLRRHLDGTSPAGAAGDRRGGRSTAWPRVYAITSFRPD